MADIVYHARAKGTSTDRVVYAAVEVPFVCPARTSRTLRVWERDAQIEATRRLRARYPYVRDITTRGMYYDLDSIVSVVSTEDANETRESQR